MSKITFFIIPFVAVVCFQLENRANGQPAEQGTPIAEMQNELELAEVLEASAKRRAMLEKRKKMENPNIVLFMDLYREFDAENKLDFSMEQRSKIKEINEELATALKKLKTKFPDAPNEIVRKQLIDLESRNLKRKYTRRMTEIMIDHQIDNFFEWDVEKIGLPKLVVDTPVGDAIGLEDAQKQRIRKKAKLLKEKIERFIEEVQTESLELITDELRDEDVEKLKKFFPN